MVDKSQIDDIKRNLNIIDIAGEHLNLRRSGNSYFALCPFHQEKTPSFSVNEELQIFHCFGCGESGDVITLFEKLNNLDFNDAILELAQRAHIKIDTKNSNYKGSNNKEILRINKAVEDFFYKNLNNNKGAIEYLKKRNINAQSIKDFSIGYSESNDHITKKLLLKNLTKEKLISYGLSTMRDNKIRDKFRNRIMFPIKNIKGDTIGFIGRVIKDDVKPKYLNSPETEVFKKSEVLYGINIAKKEILQKDFVIITEGNIDVIQANQVGIKNIVGIQGTALSQNHIDTIKRYTNKVYFALDMDSAGYKALQRSIEITEKNDLISKVISLDDCKDIDEFIRKYGKSKFIDKIINAEEFITFSIKYEIKNTDIEKYEGKIDVIKKLLPLINMATNEIKRSYYISEISKNLDIPFETIKDFQKKGKGKTNIKLQKKIKIPSSEIYFLYLILESKKLRDIGTRSIKPEYMRGSNTKKIYNYLLETDFKGENINKIKEVIFKNINKEYIEKDNNIEEMTKDLNTIIKIINNTYIKKEILKLKKELSSENNSSDILEKIKILSSNYI
jgi:DNA primase